jgi:hypothetical protein
VREKEVGVGYYVLVRNFVVEVFIATGYKKIEEREQLF